MQTLHPVSVLVGMSSFFSLVTTVIPPFFGTTWTGLTHGLSKMGYISPTSKSLMTFFFTTSYTLGLAHLCGWIAALQSSSIKILCVHMEGLMPLMPISFHAISVLCLFSRLSHFSFSREVRYGEMITESLPLLSRNAYSKPFQKMLKLKTYTTFYDTFQKMLKLKTYTTSNIR
ncbi:hypothetical protein HanRHA438_Chr03g0110831 [Helianthus annuus]|nr:hypothetical protein HanRHA438_Chr03g0110831 [Helianthus annuus]